MAQTFTKVPLSASTSGAPITIAATTSGSATGVHLSSAYPTFDEVWLWASVSGAAAVTCSLLWGGTASGNQISVLLTPGVGAYQVAPGWLMTGALTVSAYASVANTIVISGFVNRIT